MKTCSKCKLEMPEADFYLRNKTGKRRADCKECVRAQQKAHNKKNRTGKAARDKIYYAENREKIAAQGKSYRAENREKISAYQKIYYAENREKEAAKAASRHKIRKYGLTPDAFKRLVASQGGVCAICEKETKFCVDHDHDTGKVRGLLCQSCNKGIGHLKDSSDITRRATEYLQKHGK